jgi:hypothetical protein
MEFHEDSGSVVASKCGCPLLHLSATLKDRALIMMYMEAAAARQVRRCRRQSGTRDSSGSSAVCHSKQQGSAEYMSFVFNVPLRAEQKGDVPTAMQCIAMRLRFIAVRLDAWCGL